jgi:hypothetical protein
MADVNKSVNISFNASTQNLEKNLKKIPDITDAQASQAARSLDQNFKKMETSAEKTSKSISAKMKNMGKSFAAVGAAVAATGAAVVTFGQHLADSTNELVDASTKTGIAVDTLAGLRLAAEGSGLAFANLEGGLIKFQSAMDTANKGSKMTADAFAALGVDVADANGNLRDSDAVFNDAIKALGQLENTTERNATAMLLFGRAGGASLIQSGALDNLESMKTLATEFGISVQNDAINSMGMFQRKMAEFGTVALGTMQGVFDSIAGKNGINMGIEGATKAIIYLGSIAQDTLTLTGQLFENVFIVGQAAYMAMTGDIERAYVIMQDASRENATAFTNMGNAFTRASAEVAKFEKLSAASTAPAKMNATAEATENAQTAMQGLSQASAEVTENIDLIADFLNDAIEQNVELENQVRDRLTPEYRKQIDAIKELGVEIDDQIRATQNQIDALIDEAMARELSVKEQNQLLLLTDELQALEDTAAQNKKAEIIEMQALIQAAHQERLAQIDEQKRAEEDAKKQKITDLQNEITMYADLGSTMLGTFDAISDVISTVNAKKIDEIRAKTDAELQEIDQMVKSGVVTSEQAAKRRESIEKKYSDQIAEYKLKEFKLNQTSAIAGIAFDTARAIAQALTLPPGVRGATIAAVSATGAAQTAAVLAQSPPKFDVGGMVGSADGAPDSVQANLLTGEAVLDRATVDRLGGAEGIRRLQAGMSGMVAPIIIQPFKHIDRFNRALSKQTPRRVGSGAY